MSKGRSDDQPYSRDTPFSYKCNRCSRCCHDKYIQMNPYEIARLASNLGIRPYEFISKYLRDDGPYLKAKPDGACVFLGSTGCTVHGDRPLVCRLYPLGRTIEGDGSERFGELEPHPDTEGVYGEDGTIADYLKQQDTADYMLAVEAYHALVNKFLFLIEPDDETYTEGLDTGWLDIEAHDAGHFTGGPRKTPAEWLDAMHRHIAALRRIAVAISVGAVDPEGKGGN